MATLDNAVWFGADGFAEDGATLLSEGGNSTTVTGTFTADAWDATAGGTGISDFGAAFISARISADYQFSNPVENLSFDINHVNGSEPTYDDYWTIYAYDEGGDLIPAVDVIAGLSNVQDETVVINPDGSISINSAGTTANDITVSLPGKVSQLTLSYENGPEGTQSGGSGLSDLSFTIPVPPDYIVEGTNAGELINPGYGGDPGGDRVDNNDNIAGNNDDSIQALGGDDVIGAGAGNDSVDTGTGNDTVYAETGNDTVLGDAGNDLILGEAGDDSLLGDSGNDTLRGGDGNDVLQGGTESDSLQGDAGEDTLQGGDGGDYLHGGDGNDSIDGGLGDDTLHGWYGNDTMHGGDGHDYIDADLGEDLVRGGAGNDTIVGGYSTESDTLSGGTGDDSIDGQAGDDLIQGGTGNDMLLGSAGDDTFALENSFGNDTILGGETDETSGDSIDLSAVTTDTTVDLTGLDPEAGTISDGTSTVSFSEIEGVTLGAGRDTVVLADGSGADTISGFDVTNSGDGTTMDQLDVSGLTSDGGTTPVTTDDVTVTDDGAGNAVLTFVGGESITFLGVDPAQLLTPTQLSLAGVPLGRDFIVSGTAGDDVIDIFYTGDPRDRVDDNDGNPLEPGAAGGDNDSIIAGAGNDIVNAGLGDDSVRGDSGNDTLYGNAGDDDLRGQVGDDVFDGGTGSDTLVGGGGNDVFNVAQGDVAQGGDGDDFFTLSDLGEAGTDAITIIGGEGSETDGDTLQLTDGVTFADITFTNKDDTAGGLSGNFTLADNTVVNFSEIENIICFTPGAQILTNYGERAIETLKVGDKVVTRDHGLRPIRWIGTRTVTGTGRFAPISIAPSVTDGGRTGLLVSPQHRMLFTGYRAELLFGESEVLIPAKHLVDGRDACVQEQDEVTYIHLMFDCHEIIYADGIATESFHAGDAGISAISAPAREELFTLFPELRTAGGQHLSTARSCLRKHEAQLLMSYSEN